MSIEDVRDFCLSLPMVTEDTAFGEDYLLFRVCDKIFACLDLTGSDYVTVKCDPDYAAELREHYEGVVGAWHWNKKYWNQIFPNKDVSDEMLRSFIRHSFSEVVRKLPGKFRKEFPEICDIR